MPKIAFAVGLALVVGLAKTPARAASDKIDLRTTAGVNSVKGQWRYSDAKVVEVPYKGPDGKPNTTYNIEPRAGDAKFDDSGWPVIAPETLKVRRSTGLVCFAWYRIKLTVPEEAAGKRVFFQTIVDDYGEVWVDGQLPRSPGKVGGAIVAGFNARNRVELKDPKPGKVYQIAIFGINGPISAAPSNYIFLSEAVLELADPSDQ
jgi:gluconolactonase